MGARDVLCSASVYIYTHLYGQCTPVILDVMVPTSGSSFLNIHLPFSLFCLFVFFFLSLGITLYSIYYFYTPNFSCTSWVGEFVEDASCKEFSLLPSSCPCFYLFVLFFSCCYSLEGTLDILSNDCLIQTLSPPFTVLFHSSFPRFPIEPSASNYGQAIFYWEQKKKDSSPTQSTVENLDYSLAPKLISADHGHTMDLSATPSCLLLAPCPNTVYICLYTLQNKVLNHYWLNLCVYNIITHGRFNWNLIKDPHR
jgi:hypothetical protein